MSEVKRSLYDGGEMKRAFTIYYRNDSMELAKVDMAPVFEDCSPLGKADVLKDCIDAVKDLYLEAVEDWEQQQDMGVVKI